MTVFHSYRLSISVLVLLAIGSLGLAVLYFLVPTRSLPIGLEAKYIGRQSCVACHAEQVNAFTGSHHDCAMQVANDATVLAAFEDEWLEESGQKARFFRDGKDFCVETSNEQGKNEVFKIEWTFGIDPLQQYMVNLDQRDATKPTDALQLGRVQVLRWSWDTEKRKWFHLDPPDVHGQLRADDELAWTGPAQRWNNMCAACHSTNVVKGFDVAEGRYHTRFDEIDVSCESCHGPASIHLEIASRTFYRKDPKYGHGFANLKGEAETQIQTCAPCHSRRAVIAEGFKAGSRFADHHSLGLLTESVYYDDGQVLEEDYVYGSFIQSKMYHKGIRCTDCHDPHTARLKFNGNEVCTSCHQHPTFKYDTPSHHFHKPGQAGSFCVDCHMPPTTYMEVDSRRDHSIRIPRPDLSLAFDTPNACTGCHISPEKLPEAKRENLTQYLDWMNAARTGDKTIAEEIHRVDQWCDDACERWYGKNRKRPYHFAEALHAARTEPPQQNAIALLQELLQKRGEEAPAIARATALTDLLRISPASAALEAVSARKDASSIVRASAAIAATGESDPAKRFAIVKPLLSDPIRSVRVEAARSASTTLPVIDAFREPDAKKALDELKESYKVDVDRSAGSLNLGNLEQQLGRLQAAANHYEDAIRIEPNLAGPRSNYAHLLDQLAGSNRATNAELAASLSAKAQKLRSEELPLLERDLSYAPDNAAIAYKLGLGNYLNGNMLQAEKYLAMACQLDRESVDHAVTYSLLLEKIGRHEDARAILEQILQRDPDNLSAIQIISRLPNEE